MNKALKESLSLIERMDKVTELITENVMSKINVLSEVDNFNKIVCYKQNLNETTINRMLNWLRDCDCCFISAFRNKLTDIRDDSKTYFGKNNEWEEGHEFTHEENRFKNKLMVAELMSLGYGVSKSKGVYPEGMNKESCEESYFVVNKNNDPKFLDNLLRIGEYFNQDSIYYNEAGSDEGYLIGTNDCGYPAYHQKGEGSVLKVGYASNYMSRIGNKSISFVSNSAKKVNDRQDCMNDIAKTKGTDDEWAQRYWQDNDGTSFHDRKQQRIDNMKECVDFWRDLIKGEMKIIENTHPLTRKTMCEFLKENKKLKLFIVKR